MEKKFKAQLLGRGPKGSWVFLPVPFSVEAVFGSKARVAVRGTLNGASFRNSLLPNGDGTHSMPVNKALLAGAKAQAGDTVTVVLAVDTEPRTNAVPDDLQHALSRSVAAAKAYEKLSYSNQKEDIDWIQGAKRAETRQRRIGVAIEKLKMGGRLQD